VQAKILTVNTVVKISVVVAGKVMGSPLRLSLWANPSYHVQNFPMEVSANPMSSPVKGKGVDLYSA